MQKDTIEVLALLTHPVRIQIMELMRDGPKSAGELVKLTSSFHPSVGQHLGRFTNCGLLRRHHIPPGSPGRDRVRYSIDLELLETHLAIFAEAVGIGSPIGKRVPDTKKRAIDNRRTAPEEVARLKRAAARTRQRLAAARAKLAATGKVPKRKPTAKRAKKKASK